MLQEEDQVKLSVIAVGRNESLHIERCLQSLIKGTKRFSDHEILYIDSASSDNTVETAKKFPIKIYQLKPDWPLSASAGRYIGCLHARGDYLFFIDGDTILYHNWLEKGVSYLQENPDVGAVAGSVHEIFENETGQQVGFMKHRYGHQNTPREEKTMGGIALYRRSILNQVGTFNPFLAADEEPELGFRIRRAGYKLIRLPDTMAITYGPERQTFRELFRRYHSKLFAYGTTLRYCQKNGFFKQYLFERLDHLLSYIIAWFIFLIICIVAVRYGFIFYFFLIGFLIGVVIKFLKPSLYRRLLISFVKRSLMLIRTIQSYFAAKPDDPEKYPTDVIYIETETGQ